MKKTDKTIEKFNTRKTEKKDPSLGKVDEQKMVKELKSNYQASWDFMQPLRDTWDEKEALLICKLEDEISTDAKINSGVFDPRLATIVFERTARVMAQRLKGKAYGTSKNDIGKNRLMNLMRDYYYKNATYWRPMLIKERMMDLYSLVYGTMFALTPWVVRDGYIGPEMIPWAIRMAWPQPSATSVQECDWFQLGSMKSLSWLMKQPKNDGKGAGWRDLDVLKTKMGGDKARGDVAPTDQLSFVEKENFAQSAEGSEHNPKVEIRTEYKKDRWLTYAPKYDLLLRVMKNPYGDPETGVGDIPIVAKDAFPLMNSIIGLGEFERGKTLQYALNSLWNLYLDGVKYSIFPPIHVATGGQVVRSSIKWGQGEKWLMKRPNIDVQPMKMSPQGMQTFQSTYGFLLSAIMNQAGTTDISKSSTTESSMGKTPQAIRFMASRESARDEWDRVMMEETIKDRETKWINMIVKKMEKPVVMRIFGAEAQEIADENPDMLEFFDENDQYGGIKITKDKIRAKYDFEVETGTSMKRDLDNEKQIVDNLLGMVIKNPNIINGMREQKKDLNIAELMKRSLSLGGFREVDKVIIDYEQQEQGPQVDDEALMRMADNIEQRSKQSEMVGGTKGIPTE